MNIIYINHNQKAHFEILFSIIDYLTNPKSTIEFIPPIKNIYPFLYNSKIILKPEFIEPDKYKKKFFSDNYTDINLEINSEIFIDQIYDFNIITTVYPEMIDELKLYKNDSRFLLISHEISDCFDDWNNVYYHMPLGKRYFIPHYFPFYKNLPKSNTKIYIVQGSINLKRRNYYSLISIFEKYERDNFIIRILGRGRQNKKKSIPKLIDNIEKELYNTNYHKKCIRDRIIYVESSLGITSNEINLKYRLYIICNELEINYNINNSIDDIDYQSLINTFNVTKYQHKLIRLYQINQPFKCMNDDSKININNDQLELLKNNKIVLELYPEISHYSCE